MSVYGYCVKNSDRRATSIDRLLDATIDVLSDVGYHGLRVADVAEQSGMSDGALFRYFPTKNILVRDALERSLASHLVRVAAAFSNVPLGPQSRRIMLEALWEATDHPKLRWTSGIYAAAAHDPILREELREVLEQHSTSIALLTNKLVGESGEPPAEGVSNAINLVIWAMQGLALQQRATGDTGKQVAMIDLLEFIADMFYGPVPETTEH
jgi:AcrR family transcriptional regulator